MRDLEVTERIMYLSREMMKFLASKKCSSKQIHAFSLDTMGWEKRGERDKIENT